MIFKQIKKLRLKPLVIAVLSVLPIFILLLPMLLSGQDTLFAGDFDMQIQMTEAAKTVILDYKQFPFWNPWVAGGVPLFADPQFGLITPQTLFSFFVDSAYAWKLTIAVYFIVGFFSMRKLLTYILGNEKNYLLIASLVSYLWIFGSFFTLRANGGHFTFMLLTLLPLAIYLLLRVTENKKYFILLTLVLAYCINAAMHYSTILIILTLGLITTLLAIVSLIKHYERSIRIKSLVAKSRDSIDRLGLLILAVFAAIALNSYRLYQTLEYMNDSNIDRATHYEPFIGLSAGLKSIFLPFGTYGMPGSTFGPFEASNYIGTITGFILALLGVCLIYQVLKSRKLSKALRENSRLVIVFTVVTAISFTIALAGEPYALLRELPVMSSMRVSTRFFFITAFALLVLLAIFCATSIRKQLLGKHSFTILASLLILAGAQVYYHSYKLHASEWSSKNSYLLDLSDDDNTDTANQPPRAEDHWRTVIKMPYQYHALTEGTKNHRVQITADNALVDTRALPTQRCDEDTQGCAFVLTDNAKVTSWSPNRIVLERTSSGDIKLNMNQSAHWKVDGEYIFTHQKVVESDSTFQIADSSSKTYVITYSPLARILK